MPKYLQYKVAILCFIIMPIIYSLFIWGCKENQPTEEKDIPKGTFVQKLVYTQKGTVNAPSPYKMITVADLYNDNGTFRLYNIKSLVEGAMPNLSKDENWIAYVMVKNGLFIKRVNIDGTNDKEIPINKSKVSVMEAKISSDGKYIALTVGDVGYRSIGIIPANGGTYTELFNENGSAYNPEWSLDSKRIYFSYIDWTNRFMHNVPPLAKAYIASINTNGTDLKFISDTTNGFSDDDEPRWSPDGKTISFTSLRSHSGMIFPEIFTMDGDGKNVKRITISDVSPKHGEHYDYYNVDGHAQWTKDGEYLIFERSIYNYDHNQNQYFDTSDLFIISKDGTGLQNLTKNSTSSLMKKK